MTSRRLKTFEALLTKLVKTRPECALVKAALRDLGEMSCRTVQTLDSTAAETAMAGAIKMS